MRAFHLQRVDPAPRRDARGEVDLGHLRDEPPEILGLKINLLDAAAMTTRDFRREPFRDAGDCDWRTLDGWLPQDEDRRGEKHDRDRSRESDDLPRAHRPRAFLGDRASGR